MTPEQTKKFKYWQTRTIIVSMIGYALYYFVRKNFNTAMPSIEATFGITKTQLGIFLTLNGVIYGVSRFVNGFIADRVSARKFMALGLALCALVNIGFGFSDKMALLITGTAGGSEYITALTIIMGSILLLNGYFQGMGVPPVSPLMTHWVPANELATKMSIWNASHSIGAFIIAVLCGYLMGHTGTDMTGDPEMRQRVVENTASITEKMDAASAEAYITNALQHVGAWQWTFWVPAAIAVLGVIFIIVTLRDTPKSVGLPELEGTKTQLDEHDSSEEFKAFLRKKVFLNPMIWGLAVADFFVYIVRFAVLDWGPTFLQESRGLSSSMAGWTVAIFEVCGITGMLLAGWISDKFFGGRAQRTCVFCMAGVILFISLFFALPESTDPVVLLMMLAVAGFFIYGPQALIGVIASNHATKKAASTANGVVGMVSYVSVVVSGWGFGFISDHFGWRWVFITMIAMAVLGFLVLLSMWNTKSDGYEHDAAETD